MFRKCYDNFAQRLKNGKKAATVGFSVGAGMGAALGGAIRE